MRFRLSSCALVASLVASVLALTLAVPPPSAQAAQAGDDFSLEFEKYELPNGLDVILHEDHTIPMVAVNVWYHVGSKNEKPGRTGFAHLFEHMMFQGSEHNDAEYFDPLQKAGGRVNGSTTEDRTNYWENVPSNYLELALWLEADRMGYLVPAMTQEKLDNQRDVVKNERREGVDNQPYGRSEELMLPLLFPSNHPYCHTVIGSMEDLSAASLEDVQEFFRKYYTPNNASLVVAGDFDPAEAKRLVAKYFGPIPPGEPIERLSEWIPVLDQEIRSVAEDDVNLPRLYYAWHSPPFLRAGDAEFDILANVLTRGKTSRLYRSLVYEQEIAQDVSAYQDSREVGSLFHIRVTAKEGHGLDEIEHAVDAELEKIIRDGITQEELEQAQVAWEASFVRSLERIGGFGGIADLLNRYNVLLGDPDRFQWDLDRYRNATTESIHRFVRDYIDLDHRVVLRIVPQGQLMAGDQEPDFAAGLPGPGKEPTFNPPEIKRASLSNGLELFVVEKPGIPIVQANLVVRSGWADDPSDRFGAAALTAELLDEGTDDRNALEISEAAKTLGARFDTYSSFDGSIVAMNVLRRNLDEGLELMADVVLHPTFPEQELERQRTIYLGRIGQEAKQPVPSAFKTFQRELAGPGHPYSQPYTGSGTEASVKAITRRDLVSYYENNYFPNNAALIMVGDLTLSDAKKFARRAFGDWRQGTVARREFPEPKAPTRPTICLVDKPGAEQSVVVVGQMGLARSNPDYLPFEVMNHALGGYFSSRINLNLREDKGFTYGARSMSIALKHPGPWFASAQVQSQSTAESISEIVREIRDIMGERPLNADELTHTEDNLVKGFPQDFQTVRGIAGQLQDIVLYNLPLDEWRTYVSRVKSINGPTATKVADEYLRPDDLLVVVVGDREKIEESIRELNLGEIVYAEVP